MERKQFTIRVSVGAIRTAYNNAYHHCTPVHQNGGFKKLHNFNHMLETLYKLEIKI